MSAPWGIGLVLQLVFKPLERPSYVHNERKEAGRATFVRLASSFSFIRIRTYLGNRHAIRKRKPKHESHVVPEGSNLMSNQRLIRARPEVAPASNPSVGYRLVRKKLTAGDLRSRPWRAVNLSLTSLQHSSSTVDQLFARMLNPHE